MYAFLRKLDELFSDVFALVFIDVDRKTNLIVRQ